MNYKHWCIIFLIALISCKSDAELDVKIELAGHYDLSMVSKELQAQGANCNLINNELYCASSDMDLVNNVIINIGLKELPADRSILLEMPGLYEAVISELNKRDFHYTVKNLGSESWIIVEQEDLELFNQIKNQKIYEMRMAENQ